MRCKQFIILLFLTTSFTISFGQTPPQLVKWYYWDYGFPFGIKHLTLSSDSIFFFAISSENGLLVSKGTWMTKYNKLYLNSFGLKSAYPNLKIEFIEGEGSKTVTISSFDYFGKPFEGLGIRLFRPEDTTNTAFHQAEIFFVDSSGQLKISKARIQGFLFCISMG